MNNRLLQGLLATALLLAAWPGTGAAGDRYPKSRGYALDNRYQHGHYYPERGERFRALPPGGARIYYRDSPYYFHGGAWYRPWGPRFVVVAPPLGIGIDFLPPYYTTVWFGGVPYYYADNTYYLWRPEQQQYVVTAPPPNAEPAAGDAASSAEVYAYPSKGQSEEQQATDRYECHSWASRQSGFDPTEPLGGVPAPEVATKRGEYQRAQRACLEGRGYTVR